MFDFYSATIFLSVFIMIIMDMLVVRGQRI